LFELGADIGGRKRREGMVTNDVTDGPNAPTNGWSEKRGKGRERVKVNLKLQQKAGYKES
jgi:hypothetical protein